MLVFSNPLLVPEDWDRLAIPINCQGRLDVPDLPKTWVTAYIKEISLKKIMIGNLFVEGNIIGIPNSAFAGDKDRLEHYALALPKLSEYINKENIGCLGIYIPKMLRIMHFKNMIEYWINAYPISCGIKMYVQ